jgi:hypothetical protein
MFYTGSVNVQPSYAANGLNQYDSAGPRCFEYDGNPVPSVSEEAIWWQPSQVTDAILSLLNA